MPKRQQDKELSSSLACDGMCVKRKLQHDIRLFFFCLYLVAVDTGTPSSKKGRKNEGVIYFYVRRRSVNLHSIVTVQVLLVWPDWLAGGRTLL